MKTKHKIWYASTKQAANTEGGPEAPHCAPHPCARSRWNEPRSRKRTREIRVRVGHERASISASISSGGQTSSAGGRPRGKEGGTLEKSFAPAATPERATKKEERGDEGEQGESPFSGTHPVITEGTAAAAASLAGKVSILKVPLPPFL